VGDIAQHSAALLRSLRPAWRKALKAVAQVTLGLGVIASCSAFAGTAIANTPTPGLSRSDGYSEQRLLEVFALMARGQSKEALEKVEKLVQDHPNFQLAQLVYGDLLAARTRPLQSLGDMAPDTARAGASALSDLREETKQRMGNVKERPPVGSIPDQFLKMSPQTRSAIAIDASRSRLYLFENTPNGLQLKADYYVSVGKAGVSKTQEGDQRTPLGVYFVSSRLDRKTLTDFYGIGALTLNYPNMLDVRRGKSGSGIWLHGTPPTQFARAPHSTDGCLVLSNPDIRTLIDTTTVRNTPVVVASQLVWKSPKQLEDPAKAFANALESWRAAKASGDLKKTLAFYTPDFSSYGKNLDQFTFMLKAEIKASKGHDVELKDVSYFQWNDSAQTMVVSFGEVTAGQRTGVHKRQYWVRSSNEWKIFFEGVH
jgi:L,D-transpeptidase YnhG